MPDLRQPYSVEQACFVAGLLLHKVKDGVPMDGHGSLQR